MLWPGDQGATRTHTRVPWTESPLGERPQVGPQSGGRGAARGASMHRERLHTCLTPSMGRGTKGFLSLLGPALGPRHPHSQGRPRPAAGWSPSPQGCDMTSASHPNPGLHCAHQPRNSRVVRYPSKLTEAAARGWGWGCVCVGGMGLSSISDSEGAFLNLSAPCCWRWWRRCSSDPLPPAPLSCDSHTQEGHGELVGRGPCGSGIRNGGVLAAVWAPAARDRGQVWPLSLPHVTFDFGGGKAVPREGLMWPPGIRGAPAPDALSTRAHVCRIDGPTPNNKSRSASMERQLQSLGACRGA